MNNVEKSLKFVAKDQMDAAISTLEMRINRSERNFALKNMILFGQDEEILKREDEKFSKYHKKMNKSINEVINSLNSEAFSDTIKNLFEDFYYEVKDNDKAKSIKTIYKNKGSLQAIKELREDRDKTDEKLIKVVSKLKEQSAIETQFAKTKGKNSKFILLFLSIFALFVSSFLAFIIIKDISKSVSYIHQSAIKIHSGELSEEIEVNQKSEFYELAIAFERMRMSLIRAKRLLDRIDR